MPETTPDLGDALQQTISGPIGWVALVVIALSLGGLAVSFLAKQWRRDEEIAKLVSIDMRRHDEWRAKANAAAFERHKRSCRRCRGDTFGQGDFIMPPGVEEATAEDIRFWPGASA